MLLWGFEEVEILGAILAPFGIEAGTLYLYLDVMRVNDF
jgi:hypothetical protein